MTAMQHNHQLMAENGEIPEFYTQGHSENVQLGKSRPCLLFISKLVVNA